MTIELKTKFPMEWNKTYYIAESQQKNVLAPCIACDNTGKVTIKDESYDCPRCHGNWRQKEVISKTTVYRLGMYQLGQITVRSKNDVDLTFCKVNTNDSDNRRITVRSCEFDTMYIDMELGCLMDDVKEARALVKALNAAVKEMESNTCHVLEAKLVLDANVAGVQANLLPKGRIFALSEAVLVVGSEFKYLLKCEGTEVMATARVTRIGVSPSEVGARAWIGIHVIKNGTEVV